MKKFLFSLMILTLMLSFSAVLADQDGNARWCNMDQYGCWVTAEDGGKSYIMFWSEESRKYFMGDITAPYTNVVDYCWTCTNGKLELEKAPEPVEAPLNELLILLQDAVPGAILQDGVIAITDQTEQAASGTGFQHISSADNTFIAVYKIDPLSTDIISVIKSFYPGEEDKLIPISIAIDPGHERLAVLAPRTIPTSSMMPYFEDVRNIWASSSDISRITTYYNIK